MAEEEQTVQELVQGVLQSYQEKNTADIHAEIEAIVADHPDHEKTLRDLAHNLAAVNTEKNKAHSYHHIAVNLIDLDLYDEAFEMIEKAERLDKNNPKIHFNKGYILFECGSPAEATIAFQKAVDIDPTFADAHNNLFCALTQIGRHKEAFAAIEQAVQFAPEDSTFQQNRGNALKNLGRFGEAIDAYEASLISDPTNERAHLFKAEALAMLEESRTGPDDYKRNYRQEAEESLEAAVGYAPEDPYILRTAANSFSNLLGNYERALSLYQKLRDLEPENAQNAYDIGVCKENLGKIDEAKKWYEETLRLSRVSTVANNNLGCIFEDHNGDYEEAFKAYESALENKTFTIAYYNMAVMLYKLGKIEDAREYFEYAAMLAWQEGDDETLDDIELFYKEHRKLGPAPRQKTWGEPMLTATPAP